ncbi:hypothetical protein AMATHDRAFT_148184 [Amanita thiersii Skay4041]|uniref:BTB domain-containing protein n=1 Tax=Amanita thiersii Skay4041 TaxID=703135 RepID=A0A2A9NLN5_9AGAR|nr:hypothetical protein AMATHDRAFT_148184 [Amanita thiersii Skay4041]
MDWTSFHTENADFTVRSSPDNVTFETKRSALLNSQFFRDMFDCCDPGNLESGITQSVHLHEPSQTLVVLLRLLHDPPNPPVEEAHEADSSVTSQLPRKYYDPSTVIPLPLITTTIFGLVEKYVLSETIIDTLWSHIAAHVATDPLQVYGFATLHGMDHIASKASQYLMPLASYRTDEVKIIPSVEAYHNLIRLQDLRAKTLKTFLLSEELFPHGYGKCSAHHIYATAAWDAQRKALAIRVDLETDIAAEMMEIQAQFEKCTQCRKAFIAAVEMLSYKSRKIPRRLDQLPAEC